MMFWFNNRDEISIKLALKSTGKIKVGYKCIYKTDAFLFSFFLTITHSPPKPTHSNNKNKPTSSNLQFQ